MGRRENPRDAQRHPSLKLVERQPLQSDVMFTLHVTFSFAEEIAQPPGLIVKVEGEREPADFVLVKSLTGGMDFWAQIYEEMGGPDWSEEYAGMEGRGFWAACKLRDHELGDLIALRMQDLRRLRERVPKS